MARAELLWIPLGAGSSVVPRCGRGYEFLAARRQGRRPQPLFHAALHVWLDGDRVAVEMAPAWGEGSGRPGVRVTGPVGLRGLGAIRWFRYEVRCTAGRDVPDAGRAVVVPLPARRSAAAALLDALDGVPALTWGRDELGLGEMWNSNSLIAYLIARAGLPDRAPPQGGRAPGWSAGTRLAGRVVRAG